MRLALLTPLVLLAACQVDRDSANDTTTVEFNEAVAANTAEDVANTAENVAADVGNEARDIGNAIGDVDVDVDVDRNRPANAN
ncbi:MAG TPA: hypothetical protein VEC14_05950 [Reyranellaceae bacterium]|nr:hypothetical protein [Reyranellaceae bacterium]